MGPGARTVAVAVCAAVIASACTRAATPGEPPASGTTAAASVAATPDSTPVVAAGRDPTMSDDEARARAADPATGEAWRASPERIEPVLSADEMEGLAVAEYTRWQHVGDRDGARILLLTGPFGAAVLVEQAPEGSLAEVAAPLPSQPAPGADGDLGIPVADVYYDSFAVPRRWESPEGAEYDLWDRRDPVMMPSDPTTVATLGATRVVRTTSPAGVFADLDGASATAAAYVAVDPSGRSRSLGADPLGTDAGAVVFRDGIGGSGSRTYGDLADLGCAGSPDWVTWVEGTDADAWTVAGETTAGTIVIPTAENPVAVRAFEAWQEHAAAFGWRDDERLPLSASLADFVAAGVVIATPAATGDVWFVEIDRSFSARSWC